MRELPNQTLDRIYQETCFRRQECFGYYKNKIQEAIDEVARATSGLNEVGVECHYTGGVIGEVFACMFCYGCD